MCFYIYAPGKHLKIEYSSESITLLKDGSSDVIVDLLITNNSQDPINSFYILYPNDFIEVTEDLQEAYLNGIAEDISKTFLDYENSLNWIYHEPGCDFNNKERALNGEKGQPIIIKLPDPMKPSDEHLDIKFKGMLNGKCELSLLDMDDTLDYYVLSLMHFCIFKADLEFPLEPQKPEENGICNSRWMRWSFHSPKTLFNNMRMRKRLLKQALNVNYYYYEIFGPYDCRHRFRNILETTQRGEVYEKSQRKQERYDIRDRAIALSSRVFQNEIDYNGTYTDFADWRIHIDPRDVGSKLMNINSSGNVFIAGGLPNMRWKGVINFPCYEWKTGSRVINSFNSRRNNKDSEKEKENFDENFEFNFRLHFEAHQVNLTILFLPWFGLLLAIISLILSLIK